MPHEGCKMFGGSASRADLFPPVCFSVRVLRVVSETAFWGSKQICEGVL